jgi:hypothetical protein
VGRAASTSFGGCSAKPIWRRRWFLISAHAEQDYADLVAASPAAGFLPKTRLSAGAIADLLGLPS